MAFKPLARMYLNGLGFGKPWQIPGWKHLGVDINRGRHGDIVYAYSDGTVKYCKNTTEWHQGLVVEAEDKAGNVYTWVYWHIEGCTLKPGDKVKGGQKVGSIAFKRDNDRIVAPHLHVGLRPGKYDPVHSMKGGCKGSQYPLGFNNPENAFRKYLGVG